VPLAEWVKVVQLPPKNSTRLLIQSPSGIE
jgi:hypothetical protein